MTNTDSSDHYHGAILVEIRDDVKRLAEAFKPMSQDIDELKVHVAGLQVESDLWRGLWRDHETRITHLEA